MVKHIFSIGSIYLLAFYCLSLISCGEEAALRKDTYEFDELNLGWINNKTPFDNFILADTNGIQEGYQLFSEDDNYDIAWSNFLFIRTHLSKRESYYMNYRSTLGSKFSVSMTRYDEDHGDVLTITYNQLSVKYDLEFDEIYSIYSRNEYRSLQITDAGYEPHDEEILSEIEILYDQIIQGISYDEVLHLEVKDFETGQTDLDLSHLYLAKNVGLIQIVLKNGATFSRNE